MTHQEFRSLQELLHMTNREMAKWLRLGMSAISKMRSGAITVSPRTEEWIKFKLKERERELREAAERYDANQS